MEIAQRFFSDMRKHFCITLLLLLVGCSDGGSAKDFVEIIDWGPRETVAGQPFNTQPDGSSAIWFRHGGIKDANAVEVWFGDANLGSPAIAKDIGSFTVPAKLTRSPGFIPVFMIVKATNERVDLGGFQAK